MVEGTAPFLRRAEPAEALIPLIVATLLLLRAVRGFRQAGLADSIRAESFPFHISRARKEVHAGVATRALNTRDALRVEPEKLTGAGVCAAALHGALADSLCRTRLRRIIATYLAAGCGAGLAAEDGCIALPYGTAGTGQQAARFGARQTDALLLVIAEIARGIAA